MAKRYLIDTDLLIEYLRDSAKAVKYLEDLDGELFVSAVSVAELYSGVKDDDESRALERFLLAFRILPIDENVAKMGGMIRKHFRPSHGTGLADALIAAAAESADATLITFNRKHLPMVNDIEVPYRRR